MLTNDAVPSSRSRPAGAAASAAHASWISVPDVFMSPFVRPLGRPGPSLPVPTPREW